jgi:hypothetical protein
MSELICLKTGFRVDALLLLLLLLATTTAESKGD